jgi:hypothetical protein
VDAAGVGQRRVQSSNQRDQGVGWAAEQQNRERVGRVEERGQKGQRRAEQRVVCAVTTTGQGNREQATAGCSCLQGEVGSKAGADVCAVAQWIYPPC